MMRWLGVSVVVLVLDLASKFWAASELTLGQPQRVFDNVYLTLLHNEGAAFSFLAGAGGWQRWFFVAIAVLISVVLVFWLRATPAQKRLLPLGLALLLGGAVGNVWDRITLGYVVDFVQVYVPVLPWQMFNPWPAFNVADSAISAGAILIIFDSLFSREEHHT